MSAPFVDNPQKVVVRRDWDTPLLRHLHDSFGVRYRYCGLPGVDLIDVRLWQDMIDEVVAFEPPDDSPDGRRAITALRRNLGVYGINGRAFWGSFEEVVVLRQDFEGTVYSQDRVVTLYNLDFCDEIASKIQTRTQGKRLWRFEALRQILRDQYDCSRRENEPKWFILMVTVRNQMDAQKLRGFLGRKDLISSAKEYHDECVKVRPLPESGALTGTHTWAIKAFLFNTLCRYFGNPTLDALFFPCVLYEGTRTRIRGRQGRHRFLRSPMLHLVILCRFANREAQGPEQWPDGFLGCSSVSVSGDTLVASRQTGEATAAQIPSSVVWLTEHGTGIVDGL